MSGWVKTYRKKIKWEWFTSPNTAHFFEYCTLRANRKGTTWRGIKILPGSFITSLQNSASETGLTIRQVRTAIKHLTSTHELTHQRHSQHSMITVNNWIEYQPNDTQNDTQMTHEMSRERHANDTQNDNRQEIEKYSSSSTEEFLKNFKAYGSEYKNVMIDNDKYNLLTAQLLIPTNILDELIEGLSSAIEKGKQPRFLIENPHAHYEILKSFWKFRRKNPKKFDTNNNKEVEHGKNEQYSEGTGVVKVWEL
jgi:hypothetical protein